MTDDTKACPVCGETIKAVAVKCRFCNTDLVYWIRSSSTTYEITTQRVRVERGLLSKTKENVELFRIDHFDLRKPFGTRLVGPCLLHLRSSDASFPTVMIFGIPNLEALADTLRECSLRERTRRRVTAFVQA